MAVVAFAFGRHLLRTNDLTKRACQISLHKNVAGFRDLSSGEKNAFCVRPLREDGGPRLDVLDSQFVDRKAVGELYCWFHYLGECLRAELIESSYTGVENCRNGSGKWTGGRNHSAFSCARHGRVGSVDKEFTRRFHGRLAHAFDHGNLLTFQFDQNRHFATKRKV